MIKRECQVCGKVFYLYPSQIKRGKGKYCSHKCHSDAGRVERTCEHCGRTFTGIACLLRDGREKYCDAVCYGAAQSKQLGEQARRWKGGRIVTPTGYICVRAPWRTGAKADSYMLEHRMAVEDVIGRPLRRDEVVHHINEDKIDNRILNLMILTNKEHADLHAANT